MKYLFLLKRVPLFSSLRLTELQRISKQTKVQSFQKGEIICEEGTTGSQALYIVEAGQLNILVGGKVLSTLSSANYFGEVSLLSGEPHSATIQAVTPGKLLVISKDVFDEIIKKHPEVVRFLSQVLGKKLRQTIRFSHEKHKEQCIIAVVSAESQAGKSVLSTNLAASIFKQTRRRTVILDLYHSSESSASVLKLNPELTLAEILKKHREIKMEDLQRCAKKHPAGIEVISFFQEGEFIQIEKQSLSKIFQVMKEVYEIIIVDTPSQLTIDPLGILMEESDKTIFLFKDGQASFQKGNAYLNRLKKNVPNLDSKLYVGVFSESGNINKKPFQNCHFVLPFDREAIEFSCYYGEPIILSLPTCQLSRLIDGLAREISNQRVGLALSAGMASSLAHIGVLKVLFRENIPVDIMAGTSGGALFGALFAAGVPPLKIKKTAQKLGKLGWISLLDFTFPYAGFIRGQQIIKLVKSFMGNLNFEELLVPLKVIATDFHTGEIFIMDQGSVLDALRATISIPGIFTPFKYHDHFLVDGATVSPLPVDILYASGADKVIAVNACVDPLSYCKASTGSKKNIKFLPHFFDVISHSRLITSHRLAEIEGLKADLTIAPDVSCFRWRDYHRAEEIIEAGEKAAEEALPDIKRLLKPSCENYPL